MDGWLSCNTHAANTTGLTTVMPTTTSSSSSSTTTSSVVQVVCFQEYSNRSCMDVVGPKVCSPQAHCSHIGQTAGSEKSTLETCMNGYVQIQLYKNTSSCRPEKLSFAYNTTLGTCESQGGHFGVTTCGE